MLIKQKYFFSYLQEITMLAIAFIEAKTVASTP